MILVLSFRGKLQTRNPVEGLGTWKAFKAGRTSEDYLHYPSNNYSPDSLKYEYCGNAKRTCYKRRLMNALSPRGHEQLVQKFLSVLGQVRLIEIRSYPDLFQASENEYFSVIARKL